MVVELVGDWQHTASLLPQPDAFAVPVPNVSLVPYVGVWPLLDAAQPALFSPLPVSADVLPPAAPILHDVDEIPVAVPYELQVTSAAHAHGQSSLDVRLHQIVSELQNYVLSCGVLLDYVWQYDGNSKLEDVPLGFSSYDGVEVVQEQKGQSLDQTQAVEEQGLQIGVAV
jgi:hypothetical protein